MHSYSFVYTCQQFGKQFTFCCKARSILNKINNKTFKTNCENDNTKLENAHDNGDVNLENACENDDGNLENTCEQ